MPKSLEELRVIAKRVRREIVEMIGTAGSGVDAVKKAIAQKR